MADVDGTRDFLTREEIDHLRELEAKSIYIIREAYAQNKNLAVLWSIGKDSTALLWLVRKAFFGKVPIPALHIDTTFKFPEMYKFRDHYAKEWNLDLLIAKNEEAIGKGMNYDNTDAFTCCHELKTVALQKSIKNLKLDGLFVGIRRDEHGIRAKERYFSERDDDFKWDYKNQPAEMWNLLHKKEEGHLRIHPLLHWTELNIWQYIALEGIPINELYFSKNGRRYRSLGCMPITKNIESDAKDVWEIIEELKHTKLAERAGRAQDKEKAYVMQKLRSLGYM